MSQYHVTPCAGFSSSSRKASRPYIVQHIQRLRCLQDTNNVAEWATSDGCTVASPEGASLAAASGCTLCLEAKRGEHQFPQILGVQPKLRRRRLGRGNGMIPQETSSALSGTGSVQVGKICICYQLASSVQTDLTTFLLRVPRLVRQHWANSLGQNFPVATSTTRLSPGVHSVSDCHCRAQK